MKTDNVVKRAKAEKAPIDKNPNSKSNKEFRERHDISIPTFNQLAKKYVAEYG